jgi:hypothetical protein
MGNWSGLEGIPSGAFSFVRLRTASVRRWLSVLHLTSAWGTPGGATIHGRQGQAD